MFEELPLFPRQASTIAGDIDAIYFFTVGMTVFFSLLIAGLIFYFALRFRRRHPDDVGIPERASTMLEIIWSVIPLAILLFLFAWGAKVYFRIARPPADATEYFVVGKQWMWKFQHPEGNREINELHVPVGQPVKLTMTSEDVIHSFFVPEFRVKTDVLPGRYRTLWFEATEPGTYRIFCAEYCGAEHSQMVGRVVAMAPADYEAWLGGSRPGQSMAASGQELFTRHACDTCHRTDSAVRAPNLLGVAGATIQLVGGATTIADDTYLRESILDPAAKVVAGYNPVMPTYRGQISEEELLQLIIYVKGLSPTGSAAPGNGAGASVPDTASAGSSSPAGLAVGMSATEAEESQVKSPPQPPSGGSQE